MTELLIQRSPACCPFHGGPTHLQTDLWEWEGAAGWTGNSPILTEYGRVSGQQQQQPGSVLYWDYKVENSSIHFRLHKLWALNSESVTVTVRVNCIVIWLIKAQTLKLRPQLWQTSNEIFSPINASLRWAGILCICATILVWHGGVLNDLTPFYCLSSDVVWEIKPKKKNRWKTLSTKETDILENSYRQYMETEPLADDILNLDNGVQVWQ